MVWQRGYGVEHRLRPISLSYSCTWSIDIDTKSNKDRLRPVSIYRQWNVSVWKFQWKQEVEADVHTSMSFWSRDTISVAIAVSVAIIVSVLNAISCVLDS